MTATEAGTTLHYTLNGADPTESDPVVASGGTVAIAQSAHAEGQRVEDRRADERRVRCHLRVEVVTPTMTPGAGDVCARRRR